MSVPGQFPESLEARFEVLDLLGQGGFGRVLLARDRQLDRQVAIKIHALAHAVPDAIERFLQEARVTARIEAPEVVRIYDHGVEPGGEAWIVYEYIQGETLAARLARKVRLPVDTCQDWGTRVARALQLVHDQGVVHRDIKPANVMIRADGGDESPVLCDFGLAWTGQDRELKTRDGLILGTPAYMPPEVLFGGGPSPAGDQYAWAAVLYEMLYGRKLQPDPDPSSVIAKHRQGKGPDFQVPEVVVPGPLQDCLARALDPQPSRRFASMSDLARALEGRERRTRVTRRPDLDASSATVAVDRSGLLSSAVAPAPPPRRRTGPLLGAALVVLGCVAAGVLWPDPPPAPPPVASPTTMPAAPGLREAADKALGDLLRYLDEPDLEAGPSRDYKDIEHLRVRAPKMVDDWQYGRKFERWGDALEAWLPEASRSPEGRQGLALHTRWMDHLVSDYEGIFEKAEVPHEILRWGPSDQVVALMRNIIEGWTDQQERLRALVTRLRATGADPVPEVLGLEFEAGIRATSEHIESILQDLLRASEEAADPGTRRMLLDRVAWYSSLRGAQRMVSCKFRREVLRQTARQNAKADLAPEARRIALASVGNLVLVTFRECRRELGELELVAVDEFLDTVEPVLGPTYLPTLNDILQPYDEMAGGPTNTLAIRLERLKAMRDRLRTP